MAIPQELLGADSKESEISIYRGTLNSPDDLKMAVAQIKQGRSVGFQFRGVIGFVADGNNSASLDAILEAKGDENKDKPFSGMFPTKDYIPMLDMKMVDPRIAKLMQTPETWSDHVGAICHVRGPLLPEAAAKIPKRMLSQVNGVYYGHNLDVTGHPLKGLVDLMAENGILACVTTVNNHNEKEITSVEKGIEFLINKGHIPNMPRMLLTDPTYPKEVELGSFSIIDITARPDKTLAAVRDGHMPWHIISHILGGINIDTSTSKPRAHNYEINWTDEYKDLSPQEARIWALSLLALAGSRGY